MWGAACRDMGTARRCCLVRWVRLKVCRRSTLLFAVLWFGSWLLLNGLLFIHTNLLSDACTDHKSRRILQRLCEEYQQGVLSGDLCEDLCVAGQVDYKRCLYYENGKKVMVAEWRGVPIVLKSKLENFSSYEPFAFLDYANTPPGGNGGTQEELAALDVVLYATLEIKNSLGLETNLNITLPQIWEHVTGQQQQHQGQGHQGQGHQGHEGHQGWAYSQAELASLWALLQQEEYTFLRVLQDLSKHVAKVVGSCGHFYAVEYLIAGHAWDQNIFSMTDDATAAALAPGPVSGSDPQSSWYGKAAGGRDSRERIHRIALSFLDMVGHFEDDFAHRLHLCDIKPENFAIRKDLTVVAIDVDMAFFEPKMRSILEQNCTSDNDCNFFDCLSKCDTRTHKCSSKRKNSNLQVICEKIFRPWFSPTLLGSKAELPLQVELQSAVQECAEMEEAGLDAEYGRAIKHRLTRLLTELLVEESSGRSRKEYTRPGHPHTSLNF
ncbi:divergent protein kinase domain 1C [Engraulis encrasicolus]|uniref:divergent protein kinase domain 1C n=1 Tax=Engraulis encrasicolus TaxID=184585 RepID=UPI002FD09910